MAKILSPFLNPLSPVLLFSVYVKHNHISYPEHECIIQVKNTGIAGAQYTPAFGHSDVIPIKCDFREKYELHVGLSQTSNWKISLKFELKNQSFHQVENGYPCCFC